MNRINIQGGEVTATSPEGQSLSIPVSDFVRKIASPRQPEQRRGILPDGIKACEKRGKCEIWIHQTPFRVHHLTWIAEDSPVKFGPGVTYRQVRIALPYVITFAVFSPDSSGKLTLSKRNECFFSNTPVNWDTQLCYPALLNCSKFAVQEGNPLAWICTQYIDRSFDREADTSKKMQQAFVALLRCLFASGFNMSSEAHEGASWFTVSSSIDPKIATVEKWEEATAADPNFALEMPWISTGMTTAQITERIFDLHHAREPKFENADDLARVVFNHV